MRPPSTWGTDVTPPIIVTLITEYLSENFILTLKNSLNYYKEYLRSSKHFE